MTLALYFLHIATDPDRRKEFIQQWRSEDSMFGKPNWFRPKKVGWGLRPVTFQGWAYTGSWATVIAAPFIALLFWAGVGEALVWMAASTGLLVLDVRQILHAIRAGEKSEDVLYIGDEPAGSELATRQYNMQLRN